MLASVNNPEQIRLTSSQLDVLATLTGTRPTHIRTRKQLSDWIEYQKKQFPESIPETKLLRMLLERTLTD